MDTQNNLAILLKVSELENYGINTKTVIELYKRQNKREINLDELLKVHPNEEAQNIKFETFDKISVTVPVFNASGSWNKIE